MQHKRLASLLFSALLPLLGACDPEWVTLPNLPHSRNGHVAAPGHLENGEARIFVFGGAVDSIGPHDDLVVDAFDPVSGTWDPDGTYPDLPTQHWDTAVATDSAGKIYIIGGSGIGSTTLALIDVFDPVTKTWSAIPNMPTARKNAGTTFGPDGKLYVIGGSTASGSKQYSVVERYDPATQQWESVAPIPTSHLEKIGAATDCNGQIVVVGAMTWKPNGPCTSNTYVYDIDEDEWVTKTPMPDCLAGSGVVRGRDGRIYAINDGAYIVQDPGDTRVYSYDAAQDEWREEPDTNLGGVFVAAAALDDRIYAIGGTTKFDAPVPWRFEYLTIAEQNPQCEPSDDEAVRSGLTWTRNGVDCDHVALRVGCSGCNPYEGDTPCDEARPLLCINDTGNLPNPGVATDFYNGWTNGLLFATEPIVGLQLTSLEVANDLCESEFGAGFRMAEFHDGGGGWNYWSFGSVPEDVRMWTYIDDQAANCWDPSEAPCDDSDGDGVCDETDECLETPMGSEIDASGCSGVLVCNDGTLSPNCTCDGPWQGCCSWHGGVAGCG